MTLIFPMLLGKKAGSWRETLKFVNRCPICSENYSEESAGLVEEKDNASLVHLTCGRCRGYFLAMVINFGHGLSSVGMVTDLNLADARRIYRRGPLTLDEVISAHELIIQDKFNF